MVLSAALCLTWVVFDSRPVQAQLDNLMAPVPNSFRHKIKTGSPEPLARTGGCAPEGSSPVRIEPGGERMESVYTLP